MDNNTSQVALSNGLTANVTKTTVEILGVQVPVSEFALATPYVNRVREAANSIPTRNVGGYTVSLAVVIQVAGYTFTLADLDNVLAAVETANKPVVKTVEIVPGYVATISKEGVTVNGVSVNPSVLDELLAARQEVLAS